MVFKRNITITLACIITECLISLVPMIIMLYIFFMMDKINELFYTLLIVPYFILLINAILIVISLIAKSFIKTKYYVNKECLVIKEKDKVDKINYEKIFGITYDFGDLTKFNTKPSKLVLFDKEYKPLLSVNSPSIIMVYMIRKKCKNTRISYYHNKRFLFLFTLINGISLLVLTLLKIFY